MANQKPKKTAAKSSTKPSETKKEKAVVTTAASSQVAKTCECDGTLKGFFARKCDKNENVLTIFKGGRIWGALIGELIGTMLLTMVLLTIGLQPLWIVFGVTCVYIAIVGLSGANLNPLVTVGMMATRRMSAIRGVLYILAQVLGAWIGLIVINAFRLGSGTVSELPMMAEIDGEIFWSIALVELLGAILLAFFFARALKFTRKNPLAFAFTMSSALTLVVILGTVIAQNYFAYTGNTFIFNPAVALMYQIIPTAADGFGELAALAGLALAAYVVIPMIGGVLGFWISDIATKLSAGGYVCDDCECDK